MKRLGCPDFVRKPKDNRDYTDLLESLLNGRHVPIPKKNRRGSLLLNLVSFVKKLAMKNVLSSGLNQCFQDRA
jgi:hypothetical protein